MKFTSLINDFYKKLLLIKYRVFISLFIMYVVLICLARVYVSSIPTDIKVSIFDMLCDVYKGFGIVGVSRYIFPIIPVFTFILISLLDFDNKIVCLIRYHSRRSIWRKRVLYTINLSFLFSVIIVLGGYLASGILMGGFENKWINTEGTIYKLLGEPTNWSTLFSKFTSYKILFFIFTSNFLGLCAIGLLICTMKTFLKNQYVCMLLIAIIFAPVLFNKFSIVLKQMTINLAKWMNTMTIVENGVYLILLILMLCMLGEWIIGKKDIISKI
ncbi:hypothetical protein [Clostridium sp. KNHs214]|uniref:hypothetical protein n=1 Tax=Clostridium sp. KNHs214 TaxID=1540257 RepID=UPI00054EBB3A|nr:hypothetical protein [Clostridium sp. KNHs214]